MSRHPRAPKYVYSVYPTTFQASTNARLSAVRMRNLPNPPKEVRRTARCERRVHYLRSSSNRVPRIYCQTSRLVSSEFPPFTVPCPTLCLALSDSASAPQDKSQLDAYKLDLKKKLSTRAGIRANAARSSMLARASAALAAEAVSSSLPGV